MPRSAAAQCRDRWSHSRRVSREVAHFRCGRRSRSISFLTKPASDFIFTPRAGATPARRSRRSVASLPPPAQRLRDSARPPRRGGARGAAPAPPLPLPRARFILAARLGCRRRLRRLRLGALPRVAPRRLRLGVAPRALLAAAPPPRPPPPPPPPRPPPPSRRRRLGVVLGARASAAASARRGAPTPSPPVEETQAVVGEADRHEGRAVCRWRDDRRARRQRKAQRKLAEIAGEAHEVERRAAALADGGELAVAYPREPPPLDAPVARAAPPRG